MKLNIFTIIYMLKNKWQKKIKLRLNLIGQIMKMNKYSKVYVFNL